MFRKKIVIGLIAGILLSLGFLYFTNTGRNIKRRIRMELIGMNLVESKKKPKEISETIPFDFEGTLLDFAGNKVDLKDFKGKTLFINVWASWCGPCRIEMPYIQSLYDKVKTQPNLEFMLIAIDKDFEKSKSYINDKGFTFPVYHAHKGLNGFLTTQIIPLTVIVNQEGTVVYYLNGTNNFDNDDFRELLISTALTSK